MVSSDDEKFFSASRTAIAKEERSDLEAEGDLPPVVARMVVEIRSDGTRTIARGALEDLQNGERVALQADSTTPIALARELTKTLLSAPAIAGTLAKQAVRDLLPAPFRRKNKR